MKKILILGGTQFVGRNLVERLDELGQYEITLFNRQQTGSHLFSHLKKIKGDRETSDINQLKNKTWDAVIDLSAYYPNSLQNLLEILKGNISRYIFISTISVYNLENEISGSIKEDFETLPCALSQATDTSMSTYGNRKSECERVLRNATYLDKIILRPSIIYGKYDPTDRFYYWLYRAKNKNPFILPNNGKDKITLTYINDLVEIMIQSIEIKTHSTVYNVTTHEPFTLKKMTLCMNKNALTVDVQSKILYENNIIPGKDIPLWFDTNLEIDNGKLLKDFEPKITQFEKSVTETNNYYESLNWPIPKTGLTIERKHEILK